MKAFALSVTTFAMALSTAASAREAALEKAVTLYNNLPSRARELAIGPGSGEPGLRATRLPLWLNQLELTEREATATAAAFGVYGDGYRVNYRSRNWSGGAVAAGWVADALATNLKPGTGSRAEALPNRAPSRELIELRRSKMLGTLRALGTCTGALAAAVRKAAALHVSDDATQLLVKAQRDLGASALPPDDSCLS